MSLDEARALIAGMSDDDRRAVLRVLRDEHRITIHPIEDDWKTTAEAILEAIHAAPDLTKRGIRGVLAEAIFRTVVVPKLSGWTAIDFEGDLPYDLLMEPGSGSGSFKVRDGDARYGPPIEPGNGPSSLKVQVKNQRRERGEPKTDTRMSRQCGFPVYVVETQRTRTGNRTGQDGEATATRPYRFGEFDLLAVCLQPSSGDWEDFIYCPAHMLLPRPADPDLLAVMQPIFTDGTRGWSRDFDQAAASVYAHAAASGAP